MDDGKIGFRRKTRGDRALTERLCREAFWNVYRTAVWNTMCCTV